MSKCRYDLSKDCSGKNCLACVIDKIRAEIEWLKLHRAQYLTNDNKVCIDSQAVLDVIDKYKAESVEK